MNIQIKEIAKVWPDIQTVFSVPHNEKDYKKLLNLLDSLIDEVGNNERHPLSSLMEQCLYKSLETKDTHTIGLALLNQKSPIPNPKSFFHKLPVLKLALHRFPVGINQGSRAVLFAVFKFTAIFFPVGIGHGALTGSGAVFEIPDINAAVRPGHGSLAVSLIAFKIPNVFSTVRKC
jgi:hypothetical protein